MTSVRPLTVATATAFFLAAPLLAGCSSSASSSVAKALSSASSPIATPVPGAPSSVAVAADSYRTTSPPDEGSVVHTQAGDHPCSVVTEAEATAALGADPGPGQETPATFGPGTCVYGSVSAAVRVSVDPTNGQAVYDDDHATMLKLGPNTPLQDLPGVGDAGFVEPTGGSSGTAFVVKGGSILIIGLNLADSKPISNNLVTLATTAAGRV